MPNGQGMQRMSLPPPHFSPKLVNSNTPPFLTFNSHYCQARGLRERDVVTHIDGRPLLGSLRTAAQYIDRAGDSLALRIQSAGDENSSRHNTGHQKAEYQVVQHVVRQGDSVETLALLYGTPADQIRSDNRKHFPVGEPGFLYPGQVLVLRSMATGFIAKDVHEASDETPRRPKSERDDRRRRMLYDVLEGDSLDTISSRLGVKKAEIRSWNRSVFPIGEAGVVYPGQTLAIFTARSDGLHEDGERGRSEAEEESERTLSKKFAKQKSRRFSLGLEVRGAGITG